jgi:uncharacterized membrane protein YdjX (TVP38/TMEM64 family)
VFDQQLEEQEASKDNNNKEEEQEEGDDDNDGRCCCKACSVSKIVVGLILLALIVYVIVDSLTTQNVKNGILTFLEWIETNPGLGVLAFVAVYVLSAVFFVPGSLLTLGAGFVFTTALASLGRGVLLASVAVFVGASLGAIASFLLGRYLFRDGFVARLTKKYSVFEAIDKALEDKGLRIMVLLRLSPIIPFNVLNYVSGVTAIKLWHYVIACLGMIPGTVLYVFLGASAGSLSEIGSEDDTEMNEAGEETPSSGNNNKTVTIVTIVVGVIFGVAAVAITSYYAKKELNKVLEEKEKEKKEEQEQNNAVDEVDNSSNSSSNFNHEEDDENNDNDDVEQQQR